MVLASDVSLTNKTMNENEIQKQYQNIAHWVIGEKNWMSAQVSTFAVPKFILPNFCPL